MISLWKRTYGASPLHLLGQLVTFAIAIYAFTKIIDIASTNNLSLFIWFVAGALLHDLIFVPVYLVLDLVARLGIQDHPLRRVRVINHIRFPVAISGVMFLTLFPLMLGKGEANFMRTAGEQQPDYFGRWVLVTAVVFAVSAVAYAVRLRLDARRPASVEAAPVPPPGSVSA